jgi:hypothetical protein
MAVAAFFIARNLGVCRLAKLADLPFERPVRYPLAVNLKAARRPDWTFRPPRSHWRTK